MADPVGPAGRRRRAVYLLPSWPFPVRSGGSRRSASIAEILSEGFDLTVVSADRNDASIAAWDDAVARFSARRRSRVYVIADAIEGVLRGQHVLLVRSQRAGMAKAFGEWLRTLRPDLVILGRPLLTPFVEAAHEAGARVVVDADESLERVARSTARSRHATPVTRARSVIEAIAVFPRLERTAYRLAEQVWVSSEVESQSLAPIVAGQRLRVVPNAVMVPDVPPEAPSLEALCFLGWYRYPPNEAAALELMRKILPVVRGAGGPRQLVLVGPHPTKAMVRAAEAVGDVTITGEVDNVVPLLRAAGALVVPIRSGGGTRIKILEAAAAGVPVVSTAVGVTGLGMTHDRHVLIAETPEDFAYQIRRLASQEKRADLVQTAFEFVRDRNSLEALRTSVDDAIRDLFALPRTER